MMPVSGTPPTKYAKKMLEYKCYERQMVEGVIPWFRTGWDPGRTYLPARGRTLPGAGQHEAPHDARDHCMAADAMRIRPDGP